MPRDFDKEQNPNAKSKHHGKKDREHGPKEKGRDTGALREQAQVPFLVGPDGEPLVGSTAERLAAALPSYFYVPYTPPVRDQDGTPMCVAYSNAYDQAQHDRPEGGKFFDFWEQRFFDQIGGGPNGAYMSAGVKQRRDYGYPTVAGEDRSKHRIRGFAQIELTASSFKSALTARKHGILVIGPWYHSWFHPFASGKLPAPDYEIGGHAIWARGYNDRYGIRFRNSWGTDFGLNGDFFMPYAFLSRMWQAFVTTDY